MNVWVTSDHHIGHGFIAALRFQRFVEDNWADDGMNARLRIDPVLTQWHDEILAVSWDKHIRDDDTVYIVGDTSSGSKNAALACLDWYRQRPGRKILVSGNHDPTHPMHREAPKWIDIFTAPDTAGLQPFHSVVSSATRKLHVVDGQTPFRVRMSHFPYDGDHFDEDRFEEDRLRDMGAILLHGHTHQKERVSRSKRGTLQIHVGVDAWVLRPVSLDEIIQIVKEER